MRQTSSITLWFSTVLRRACPSFSHAPTEPCSPTPDQDHVRGQRPLEAPAFSDSWHDLADVHVYTCEWIYIYIHIYIHSTIIHMHIYSIIYISTVSPVFWNSLGMSKSLSHRSRRQSTVLVSTEFPCDENGQPWAPFLKSWFLVRCHTFLWFLWKNCETKSSGGKRHLRKTSGSLWVKPIMCSYINHHLSHPPNVKHPPETIV